MQVSDDGAGKHHAGSAAQRLGEPAQHQGFD